jgi:predicted nucleotidyltransferase
LSDSPALPHEWLERLVLWAHVHDRIDKLFVFGSRARGDHRPDSDLDVAVLLTGEEDGERLGYWICMAERWRAQLADLPVKVDLQYADPETDERVWPGVQRDGRLIYSRR